MNQLALLGVAPKKLWAHVPVEDPRARAVYDRHYSRQTKGAEGILAPGQRFLMLHEGDGLAVWGVVRNRFLGEYRWRNTICRNESRTMTSDLIRAATAETFDLWARRYKSLPPEDLETEIGIEETKGRRSRRHPPGHCYALAGWELVRFMPYGHGRSAKAIYVAPRRATDPWLAFGRHWMLIGQWMQIEAKREKRERRRR